MADGLARGEMPRAYEPGAVERRIYEGWMERGYFHASDRPVQDAVSPLSCLPQT